MTGPMDILGLIDAAVDDWETGPDAVRYNGPKPTNPVAATGLTFAEACANLSANLEVMRSRLLTSSSSYAAADATLVIGGREVPVTDFRLETDRPRPRPVTLGMLGIAAEVEQHLAALTQAERDEFTAYWQAGPWNFEQAWRNWVSRRAMESVEATMTVWGGQFATVMAELGESLQAFARAFSRRPCGARECSCHPAPFPAARDYRRRTKHRNRRRR